MEKIEEYEYVLTQAINLAKPFEGLHDLRQDGLVYAYHDPVGYPTIGYGKLLSKVAYEDLSKYKPQTVEQCEQDLKEEMFSKLLKAYKLSPILKLHPNKAAAIADFCFNLGEGNYSSSTLKRLIDKEEFSLASEEFKKWNKAGGKVLKGLTLRREAEKLLFLS